MKFKNLLFIALTAFTVLSCSKTPKISSKANVTQTSEALPGYYGQWLYIKTNGSNQLPDMSRYNWDISSAKRSVSPALLHVQEYGPSNVGGRIRAMVVNKSNPSHLIVGGVSGGVFVSRNNGASWKALNDQALSPSITYMDQNPFMHNVIYYCTGEASGNSADLLGAGIFKSTDTGNTFVQLPTTTGAAFLQNWSLKCSLKDTNTLFVATHANGLWRSTDAGATFTKVHITSTQINDLEVFPDGSVMITIKGSGVFRSPNGNAGTFVKVASVVSTSSARTELAYCKNFPKVVYAAISGPDNSYNGVLKAFYKSSDGGLTFTERTNPNGTVNFGFTWYTLTMGVKDNDSNAIFIGSVNCGFSRNGGSSWASANQQHADNHIVVNSGNNMYLGSDGGLCMYNWSSFSSFTNLNNGLNITQFYAGDVSPHTVAVMAGAQDNGTKEGRNLNPAFSNVFGADGGYCFYHAAQSSVKYYSTQNGAVYRNGVNVSNNLPTTDTRWFIHPYHVSAGQGDILVYPSNTRLYYSSNGGSSYKSLGTVSSGRLFCANSTEDGNPAVFAGGSSCFVAVDSAANNNPVMVDLRLKMPVAIRASFIGAIKPVPGYRDRVYLAFSNVADSGRVYMGSNLFSGTPVFKNISGNLPKGLPVNWVECDPYNPENVIFAGTDYGLYVTEDGGKTWVKDTRLPSTVISSIKIHRNKKDIYFFTHGRGIFKGQINNQGISSVKESRTETGFVLYPVPASNMLHVKTTSESALYRIYDFSGKLLLQGTVGQAGDSVDVSSLPAGNYVFECLDGTRRENSRFNIVR